LAHLTRHFQHATKEKGRDTVPAILRRALVLVAALVLSARAPALAQTTGPSAADDPIVRLPTIRVIAPEPLGAPPRATSTPSRIDVLRGDDLDRSRPTVLPYALERLPGVTLQNEQGNAFQPDLTLRGFTASPVTGLSQGVSVFLDGVRINEPTVEEVNFDLLPREDIERVEIVRGPAVLFGRNTLGGAINIVTRRGGPTREVTPEIAVGSFLHREYRLRAGGELAPLDYALTFNEAREDGYRDRTRSRLTRLFGKLGLHGGDTDATVSYQWADNRIEQAGSLPERDARRHPTRNFTGGDFFAPHLNFASVNIEHTVASSLVVGLNGFLRHLSTEQFNVSAIAADSRVRTETLSSGGVMQLKHRTEILGRPNTLVAGAEFTRHLIRSRTFEEEAGERSREADVSDLADAIGVFAQNALTVLRDPFGPESSVVITLAGRWDHLRHDIEDKLGGPSGGQHTFSRPTPRAGVNINVTRAVGIYASYSEGFRAPAFLELTCAGPGAICPGLQVGVAPDPPLEPVKAKSYEIGIRVRPLPWLETDASAFRTDLEDDIFAVAPGGGTGVFFQNIGRTRREGVEAGVRARGRTLETFVNYSFVRATFQDTAQLATPLPPGTQTVRPGDSFAAVPNHRINVGVDYRPWPWLTVSADAHYVSSQILRGDEANRHRPLPAYVVVNAGVAARAGAFEGFMRVNNVFDFQYETFGTYAVNGRADGTPTERFLTPAPPVNLLFGAKYTF
jgi:outer membrane receptor protein involved in Fe transport